MVRSFTRSFAMLIPAIRSLVVAGSTLYLPVEVEGALFSCGVSTYSLPGLSEIPTYTWFIHRTDMPLRVTERSQVSLTTMPPAICASYVY